MKTEVGKVIKLFISREEAPKRQNRLELYLKREGVIDDKFYNRDIERSVLLSSLSSYEMALERGISMEYGLLGENILIDYNPYLLPIGTQLEMGEVVIEIARNCTICKHLSVVDKRLPKLLKDDRGIFIKVIKEGKIEEGDEVYIVK
jgi:MOSC domain-containing protein YiiM